MHDSTGDDFHTPQRTNRVTYSNSEVRKARADAEISTYMKQSAENGKVLGAALMKLVESSVGGREDNSGLDMRVKEVESKVDNIATRLEGIAGLLKTLVERTNES